MAKKKKWKKKLGKALMAGAALAGGLALARRGKSTPYRNVHDTGAVAMTPGRERWGPGVGGTTHIPTRTGPWDTHPEVWTGAKKGGRIGAKKGGRTRKQLGGALGSTARRDMRSGYYPSDMGMRGGTMYKKGGRVKSMGIAKRGGGAAKR